MRVESVVSRRTDIGRGRSRRPGDGARPALAGTLGGTRRRRPVHVALGALFVVGAGLLGALLITSVTATRSVLVAAVDIEPGHVVEAGDLRVVEISELGEADVVEVARRDLVVGRLARGPIPAGALIHPDQLTAAESAVPAGWSVVGAALEPGAAPGPALRAGDRVDVLAVAPVAGLDDRGDGAEVVATAATVWAVSSPDGAIGGRSVVSLLVPVDRQAAVAQAAADGRLRLTLVGG
ncbi:MAG: SAF domain-containing protein [Acidimicrobiales bacterium]